MNIVICGTRKCPFAEALVEDAYETSPWGACVGATKHDEVHIIHGASGDVDHAGMRMAARHGWSCEGFEADWDKYGMAAGPIRNRAMAARCDAVIALWDGVSRGTLSMIVEAMKAARPVFIYPITLVKKEETTK